MWWQTRSALRSASGIATALIAMQHANAQAADDPFALRPADKQRAAAAHDPAPADPFAQPVPQNVRQRAAGDYEFYARVIVNGERRQRMARVREMDDGLALDAATAFAAGLVDTMPQQAFVPLASLPGVAYDFDWLAYELTLTVKRHSDGPNMVSITSRPRHTAGGGSAVTALIVDYDVTAQTAPGGTYFGGIVSPRLVHGNASLESTFRFSTGNNGLVDGVQRLDTSFVLRRPEVPLTMVVGDFVNRGTTATRAVRMAGFQIGTDYSLRPDLITQPLFDVAGDVAVPTAIDVLVNDRRVGQAAIEAGEFTVRDVPVPMGRGNVGVVVRDALGREVISSVSFYNSRKLLAPGLLDASFSIGALRRSYATRNDHYGDMVMSVVARRGFTRTFTGALAMEAGGGVVNGGIDADLAIGSLGLLSINMRASRNRDAPAGMREGHLLAAGFESVGRGISGSIQARWASRQYQDVASASGSSRVGSMIAANLSFDLRDLGRLRVAAIRQDRYRIQPDGELRETVDVISANYRRSIGQRANLFVDASYRKPHGQPGETTVLAGISIQLGHRGFAQASYTSTSGGDAAQAAYYRPDAVPGDIGYSLAASAGQVDRFAASLSARTRWLRLEGQVEHVGGSTAARANARGSLILVDGGLFASEGHRESYIIVDSGKVRNVPVQRENRDAGHTGSDGKLLIDKVSSYIPTKIGIDPGDLPLEVTAHRLEDMVAVPPGAVAKLQLGVDAYRPDTMQLRDTRGQFFPPGSKVVALPSRREYYVGFDGLLEINATLDDAELVVEQKDGTVCLAELADRTRPLANGTAQLRCFLRKRAFPIAGNVAPQATMPASTP